MNYRRLVKLFKAYFFSLMLLTAASTTVQSAAKSAGSENEMKVTYSYRKNNPIIVVADLVKCKDIKGPLKIEIYDDDWCIKHSDTIENPKAQRYTRKFDSSELMPRGYSLKVTLLDDNGKAQEIFTEPFRLPDESKWMNNQIGISDTVPAPFTPLKVDGDTIHCRGREYRPGKNGALIDKIIAGGKQLLAAPIRFEIGIESGKPEFMSQNGEFIKKSDTEVVYLITQKYKNFEIRNKLIIEYDGMIRIDSSIEASENIRLNSLKLLVPFKKEFATLYNISAAMGNSRYVAGALDQKRGWNGIFHPLVWLGDEDRGLLWFAEWMKDWAVKDEENTIRVVPAATVTELIITMIDAGKEFIKATPVTYTFGLQASPVKPMMKDWRTIDRVSWAEPKEAPDKIIPDTTPITFTYTSSGGWMPYHGYVLEKDDESKYLRYRDYIKSLGIPEITYTFIDNIQGSLPEFRYYFDEWYNGNANPAWAEVKNTGIDSLYKNLAKINCEARSWIDFSVWQHVTAARKFDIDGYYYDLAMPYPTWNVGSGCRYTDFNGNVKGKHSIFSRREIAKRIYTALREMKNQGQTYILGHDSGNQHFLPITAFCDMSYNGEQYAVLVRKNPDDYTTFDCSRFLDLGHIRAQHTGRQFGIFPFLLPPLRNIPAGDKAYPGIDKYTEILYSFFGIHDINVEWKPQIWRWFLDVNVAKKYEDMKRRFGMKDEGLEFIPYWNPEGLFEIAGEDYGPLVDREREGVHMSMYLRRGEKKALLMISNLDKKAHKNKQIKLDLAKMGLPDKLTAFDHENNKITVDNGMVFLDIGPQTLKVVHLETTKN